MPETRGLCLSEERTVSSVSVQRLKLWRLLLGCLAHNATVSALLTVRYFCRYLGGPELVETGY
jgi:hypothetical protein